MKEGFDKDIDSLLRRRARGAAQSFADGDGAHDAASAHLDADALGAFAEGALPPPARLAAASHLADCDRCRGVVVALSRAPGEGAELKQTAAAAVPASTVTKSPAAWRAWVAALFSPRVLRYAAPALALSAVAVVSYVALRTRDAGSLENAQSAHTRTQAPAARPDAAAPTSTGTADVNQEGAVVQNPEDPSSKDEAAGARPQQQPPLPGRGPNAGEAPQPVTSDMVAGDVSAPPPPPAPSASPEAPAEMARAAPRPAAVEESESRAKSEDGGKERGGRAGEPVDEAAANDLAAQQRARAAQSRVNNVQMPDGGTRDQRRSADNNASNIYGGNVGTSAPLPRESERDAAGAGAARRSRPAARAEQRADDAEATRVGETREAAGRRFRREGSAWVDVNYKPSMSSTGVRRGSEAFRALVADVPLVGRVAGQLRGEVVVVVGGRAYRIR
ncbi:MAG TPA: hypothetical protein VF611_16435 [Pyrinomonadaceae bacterium]|jgi:hypothetical protein